MNDSTRVCVCVCCRRWPAVFIKRCARARSRRQSMGDFTGALGRATGDAVPNPRRASTWKGLVGGTAKATATGAVFGAGERRVARCVCRLLVACSSRLLVDCSSIARSSSIAHFFAFAFLLTRARFPFSAGLRCVARRLVGTCVLNADPSLISAAFCLLSVFLLPTNNNNQQTKTETTHPSNARSLRAAVVEAWQDRPVTQAMLTEVKATGARGASLGAATRKPKFAFSRRRRWRTPRSQAAESCKRRRCSLAWAARTLSQSRWRPSCAAATTTGIKRPPAR